MKAYESVYNLLRGLWAGFKIRPHTVCHSSFPKAEPTSLSLECGRDVVAHL